MDRRLAERDVPLPGFGFQKQRYFTDEAVSDAIDSALARVTPGKRTVILRGKVDADGIAGVLAVRPNDVWTIGIIGEYEYGGTWGAGFEIKAEF